MTIDDIADAALGRGIRIAAAESLTSGLIAAELGRGHDAAEWFAGSVVAYQPAVKQHVLQVDEGLDPCSAACAEQLATGVRALLEADIAVSATGVGGPDPEDGHEPGTVYLGWSTTAGSGHRLLHLDGGPSEVLDATVARTLDLLSDVLTRAGSLG